MKTRRLALACAMSLAFLVPTLGCSAASPEAKKAKHLERAKAYFDKGQYQEALIEYKNVVQIDPKDAEGHYHLALTYLKVGGLPGLQGAFAELSRTIELAPSNRDAQLKLGELYLLGREPAKARARADVILASAPKDQEGLILRGQSLISEKAFDQGITELRKAIELNPKIIRVYLELASAYVQKKDFISAEATLQQALSVDSQSTETRLALGDLQLLRGKPDQADVEYQHALEMAPDKETIYLKLAEFYRLIRKWDQAEATYLKLAERKPADEKPRIVLGEYYWFRGQRDKALESYQRASQINPASVLARDKVIGFYLDTGKLTEAENLIRPILERNKKDLDGRFFDARLRLARGKTEEAIELLQGVMKDEPQSATAHYFLGLAWVAKNNVGQARQELNEAVKFAPNLVEARTALAAIHLAEGSSDLAIEQARAALRINPGNLQAAVILGDAYLRKSDLAKGKQMFESIARQIPKEPLGHHRLGLIARAEHKPGQALAYFEEALRANPNFVDALSQIADIQISQGKLTEARDRVARQLQVVPDNALMYNLMGSLWVQAHDSRQAEASFKKAIELNPALPISYLRLAELYRRTGKVEQAVHEYESILSKKPDLIPALMMLGIISEQQNQYQEARARYEAVLKHDPKFAPAANNLAWIIAQQGGNIDTALTYAEVAREQQSDDPHIADTLGWIYYKKNAFLRASSLLKEAAEKLPDNPIVHYHYGLAQQKLGDPAGAKRSLQTALKLSRTFPGADDARQLLKKL